MAGYALTYDLVNETGSHDYQPLWDELERIGAHRMQYSVWLLNLTDTPREIVDHFKRFTDDNDRLFVTRLHPNPGEYAYDKAMAGTNNWLSRNPPT